uniref:Aminotransferase-like plant mobile domain-containing protein n=1 Tax=Oryza punctata TaxID=4537 RepID=A0A0E0MM05_ORYPU
MMWMRTRLASALQQMSNAQTPFCKKMAEYLQEKATKAIFHTVITTGNVRRRWEVTCRTKGDMEEEWPYPLLSKEIDARHRAKKISDGNSCSTLPVLIPRTAGWWDIDPRWKPRQKRQADNRYRRSMHLRMTPWIEAWSQALNDVVHETRAYDHSTYEQYMAWYSSQTRFRLLAPEDPDERGPPNIEQTYDMQHAPPAHLTTDIAGELVREAKTLWEKLRDGIAGTNQEVMATVDSLHRKGKRIMRLASCRHSSDVYTMATSRRTFEQMPERPSTCSRPSTSARPSASARRSTDGRAAVRSTSVREAPTIPTIPEITQMSERLGGFGVTQAQPERPPPHSSAPITSQFQGGFAAFAEGTRMVRPVPQMPQPTPHMIPQMTADGLAKVSLPYREWTQNLWGLLTRFHYMHLHMAPTHGKDNPLIDYSDTHNHHFVYTYIDGTFLPYMTPTSTNDNNSVTFYMDARHVVWVIWTCCNKVIGYLVNIPPIVMKFHICEDRQQGLGRTLHRTAGDMSSFGGGSSSVPNELRASQTADAPQMTQPTQPDDGDFQGNIHDPRRSNRERHEPNRLSLSGPRHAAGRRKKTASKRAKTSRTMIDHDDE